MSGTSQILRFGSPSTLLLALEFISFANHCSPTCRSGCNSLMTLYTKACCMDIADRTNKLVLIAQQVATSSTGILLNFISRFFKDLPPINGLIQSNHSITTTITTTTIQQHNNSSPSVFFQYGIAQLTPWIDVDLQMEVANAINEVAVTIEKLVLSFNDILASSNPKTQQVSSLLKTLHTYLHFTIQHNTIHIYTLTLHHNTPCTSTLSTQH